MVRPPEAWSEADILSLVATRVKESINLDYKQSRALQTNERGKDEISKHVSAFANAAGGVIVFGVAEDGHLPTGIDGGVDPVEVSKEWLENVINSTIRPRIDGVRINQVELTASHPGRVLYVVAIPQATSAGPHQAGDKRYYKRFNFQSVPMEDYEIRDVMRRSRGPDLYCTVTADGTRDSERSMNLDILVGNRSAEPAFYAFFDIYVDADLQFLLVFDSDQYRKVVETILGEELELYHLKFPWIASEQLPIWQGNDLPLMDRRSGSRLSLYSPHSKNEYAFAVTIRSPDMPRRTTLYRLHLRKNTVETVRHESG